MTVMLAFSLLAGAPEILSARECIEVFGDEDTALDNRRERESRLNFIVDSDTDVVLDHSFAWVAPTPTEIRNLELIDTSTDGSTAYVAFAPSREDIACEDGLYGISVDDSLGSDGRVVAVLRRALLLEMDGSLCYLLPSGVEPPYFRISWSSRFGVHHRSNLSKRTVSKTRRTRN